MKAFSLDLRQRIVEAYERGEGSQRSLARRFAVSPNGLPPTYLTTAIAQWGT